MVRLAATRDPNAFLQVDELMWSHCRGSEEIWILERGWELSPRYQPWAGGDYEAKRGTVVYWVFSCPPISFEPRPGECPSLTELERAPAPVPGAEGAEQLHLDSPASDTTSALPVVELKGGFGSADKGHAIVIALDLSQSTIAPSGFDVDGDGPTGRTGEHLLSLFPARVSPSLAQRAREEDFDDSILIAELTAAKLLIDRIDLSRNRIALIAFSSRVELVAPLGSSRQELLEGLQGLRTEPYRHLTSSAFGKALGLARSELAAAGDLERTTILLSDLAPASFSTPDDLVWDCHRHVVGMRADGVRLEAIALGPLGADVEAAWSRLARCTGGTVDKLEQPGDIIVALREIDLAGVSAVRARNETAQTPARALRTFPTGEFDGFIDLVPGRNSIRIEADLADGRRAELGRVVHYSPGDGSPEQLKQLKALVERRTLELEAWEEMRRTRRAQKKVLELGVDD